MSGVHLSSAERDPARIVQAIRAQQQGRDDASGTVTLVASAATTTVQAPNCAETSEVFLHPKTADAAAEVAGGAMYVSTIGNGSFVITHKNSASVDRTFSWTARG